MGSRMARIIRVILMLKVTGILQHFMMNKEGKNTVKIMILDG
jgi:hypothetical protein